MNELFYRLDQWVIRHLARRVCMRGQSKDKITKALRILVQEFSKEFPEHNGHERRTYLTTFMGDALSYEEDLDKKYAISKQNGNIQ